MKSEDPNKIHQEQFDKLFTRELPSQVPMHVEIVSYMRIIRHATTEHGLFACKKNGARILARCVRMHILDRETHKPKDYAPVLHLYCAGCDKVPEVHGGDAIYADQLRTMSV